MLKLETYLNNTTPVQRENALLEQGDKAVSQVERANNVIATAVPFSSNCQNLVEDILLER